MTGLRDRRSMPSVQGVVGLGDAVQVIQVALSAAPRGRGLLLRLESGGSEQ